jgi:hypothetical protein
MLWAPVDLGLRGRQLVGIVSWTEYVVHSNKWYQIPWSKTLKNLRGHMVMGEPIPVNVSEVTRVVKHGALDSGLG